MRMNNRGNWSLIGLLMAVAIVCVLGAMYFTGGFQSVSDKSDLVDQHSKKKTVYGKAMDKASGVDCKERLNQIRLGIQNYKATATTEDNPLTLKDVGLSVGSDYFICPVSNQPYTYDPATGTVKCQYAGHQSF